MSTLSQVRTDRSTLTVQPEAAGRGESLVYPAIAIWPRQVARQQAVESQWLVSPPHGKLCIIVWGTTK